MKKIVKTNKRRTRRKKSIRNTIFGTALKPRLSVFKSNKYIYIQAIDDDKGITIAAASSITYDEKKFKMNKATSEKVGEDIAKKLKEKNIEYVVFDRNGFLYTGRIKSLADSARKNGLKF